MVEIMGQPPTLTTAKYPSRSVGGVCRLWLDGVGAFLVCFDSPVRIGGLGGERATLAEVSLMSNLSRHHARISRSNEVWLLEPTHPTSLNGRQISGLKLLTDGDVIRLGTSVELKFRVPSQLSATARLEFVSSHRPAPSVDGIILMTESCLLGPASDSHIVCDEEADSVLLTRRANGLWCHAKEGISSEGNVIGNECGFEFGKVYSGKNWRLRLETVT